MGETTRDKWHEADIGGERGTGLDLPMPEWLLAFDAEAEACLAFEETARDIGENGYRFPCLKAETERV
ncbi:hypothetical protein J3R82DRAFT_8363 [Butyriboletus roseoflavus]|nr:hypothetical protein J3R82DRAFT_8363 [Butyriboletus roseoflavus]